jgi:UDP-N-acetyl-D-galactosamine dehydrogenase
MSKTETIGVVGLGYVGLPLAVAFSDTFHVVGYDRSESRVQELSSGKDHTGEVEGTDLVSDNLSFTADPQDLTDCTFIVVAVPTPIDRGHEPDLRPLESASTTVGGILQKGMMVVYESTVYPGVTEDVCCPILEKQSGLRLGDFDLGYSPERINPGDKEHTVRDIVKVVSGHTPASLERASTVYGAVITAGIHEAPTIKTAEASKVIENVQRDLNIALMNELSMIFSRVGVNTKDVLEAAGTKWNFHHYSPGLVGGHCIGVDPYYLTHLAMASGYHPEVILAGRRINDSMGAHVADIAVHQMSAAGAALKNANVWVLGMTFKQNVPDFRNTKAVDVIEHLQGFGVNIRVWEPLVSPERIRDSFGLESLDFDAASDLDAVIVVTGHDRFRDIDLKKLRDKMRTPILVDARNFFDRTEAEAAGFFYTCL